MKYHYEEAVRWFRWTGSSDVRAHRPPKGWTCYAEMFDAHPVTGRQFAQAQWWVCETFVGDR